MDNVKKMTFIRSKGQRKSKSNIEVLRVSNYNVVIRSKKVKIKNKNI